MVIIPSPFRNWVVKFNRLEMVLTFSLENVVCEIRSKERNPQTIIDMVRLFLSFTISAAAAAARSSL